MSATDQNDVPPCSVQVGELIGGYRIERQIGRGGMATVFFARHARLGREAAVKVLNDALAADTQLVSRFFREAKIVNDVRHPNLVDIYDFVESDRPRRVAAIMEYLPGPSLSRLPPDQPLTFAQKLTIIQQLSSTLRAVHALGVIHRDLKPDNVIVCAPLDAEFGDEPCVKMLDFGIAKVSSADAQLTGTGFMMGTPRYMAPEQIAGEAVTPATDIYALGEIIYELFAERPLFQGPITQILRDKLNGPPAEISVISSHQGGPLRALVAQCLSTEQKARPSLDEIETVIAQARTRPMSWPKLEAPLLPAVVPAAPVGPPEATLNLSPTMYTRVSAPARRWWMAAVAISALTLASYLALRAEPGEVETTPLTQTLAEEAPAAVKPVLDPPPPAPVVAAPPATEPAAAPAATANPPPAPPVDPPLPKATRRNVRPRPVAAPVRAAPTRAAPGTKELGPLRRDEVGGW